MHKPEIMILSVCLSNGMHEENYDVFFFFTTDTHLFD